MAAMRVQHRTGSARRQLRSHASELSTCRRSPHLPFLPPAFLAAALRSASSSSSAAAAAAAALLSLPLDLPLSLSLP